MNNARTDAQKRNGRGDVLSLVASLREREKTYLGNLEEAQHLLEVYRRWNSRWKHLSYSIKGSKALQALQITEGQTVLLELAKAIDELMGPNTTITTGNQVIQAIRIEDPERVTKFLTVLNELREAVTENLAILDSDYLREPEGAQEKLTHSPQLQLVPHNEDH